MAHGEADSGCADADSQPHTPDEAARTTPGRQIRRSCAEPTAERVRKERPDADPNDDPAAQHVAEPRADRAAESRPDRADHVAESRADRAVESRADRVIESRGDRAVESRADRAVESRGDRAVESRADHVADPRADHVVEPATGPTLFGRAPACRSERPGWAGAHRHGAVRPRRRASRRERPPDRWC